MSDFRFSLAYSRESPFSFKEAITELLGDKKKLLAEIDGQDDRKEEILMLKSELEKWKKSKEAWAEECIGIRKIKDAQQNRHRRRRRSRRYVYPPDRATARPVSTCNAAGLIGVFVRHQDQDWQLSVLT